MDKKNTGFITKAQFHSLFDILHILLAVQKNKNKLRDRMKEIPKWRQRVHSIYTYKLYDGSLYLLIIFSLLMIFWRESMEIYGGDYNKVFPIWIIICVIINFIFFIDMIFRFIYQGIWEPLRSFYAVLEIGFQIISIIATLKYVITLNYGFTVSTLEFIILVRLIKILQLLDEIKTWKIILKTLRHLVVPFMGLFVVQLGIIYTYAIIGERLYGGKINYDNLKNLTDVGLGKEYLYMNFNDLVSSFITLLYFSLAWTIIFKMFISVVPGYLSMLYTFSFFIFSILCLWNIMVAVSIEVYSAVSNYYDRFAKSRVQYVDEKLRKKMQKLREIELRIKKANERAVSLDDSFLKQMPKLVENNESIHVRNYYDQEFVGKKIHKSKPYYINLLDKFDDLPVIEEVKEENMGLSRDIEAYQNHKNMQE